MSSATYSQFLCFLREELALPHESIAIAERSSDRDRTHLPIVLWQYGLITLEQLDRIYDWLEEVA